MNADELETAELQNRHSWQLDLPRSVLTDEFVSFCT
jgi:hypothetical protein